MSAQPLSVSPALKSEFDRDGFVVLPEFFAPGDVRDVCSEIDRYIAAVVPGLPAELAMYDDKNRRETLKQMPLMAEHDGRFHEMLHHGKTVALAELLLGCSVVGKELAWFNKAPLHSRETPPHQDGYYFMIEPQEALTMWIALDEVDKENGCLRYVRGSHRKGLRPHLRSEILGFSQGIPDYGLDDFHDEVVVSARPGDLLVHHSLTIHSAGPNGSSTRQRRSLALIYYSTRAKQDADKLQAYHQTLIEDWKRSQKI